MASTTFPIDGAQSQFTNYAKEMEEWEEEDDILLQLYVSNTTIISQYLEEEDQPVCKRHRGSIPGHKVIDRQREAAHARLWNDYFSENPTFGERKNISQKIPNAS
ncbi:hypothetical protein RHMOL_Rhmol09G0179200 [Rhododendron molle]|uniref:Uncharacterized protein n=1 Tax=Rhododendron molle TaxID=49168 RepID=A0ACC0MEA7_RHOML|nr:hypothetical protein RHMOL_Rhmol09G0179200 [Rhododendron molle]